MKLKKLAHYYPFRKSILFFTFHKCASTLFNDHILPNVEGYNHINIESDLYNNLREDINDFKFKKHGHLYGPLRIGNPEGRSLFTYYQEKLMASDLRSMKSIFFIRDPRDILVSEYFSFKYSHGISSNSKVRDFQMKRNEYLQTVSVNQYAIDKVEKIRDKFHLMQEFIDTQKEYVIIKYEDLVENFEKFSKNLREIMDISPKRMNKIYDFSRPKENEDIKKHQRSGKISQYKSKLSEETITVLNDELKDVLNNFCY